MTYLVRLALAVLTVGWLACSSLGKPIQQPSEPGKDQLEALRSAKTAQIITKVSSPRVVPNLMLKAASDMKNVAERLLGHAGVKSVASGGDLTVHVELRIESTFQITYSQRENEKPKSSVTPTGTTFNGIFRFDGAKGNLYSGSFTAFENDESEASLAQAMRSFSLSMLESIGKVFGPRTIVNVLKDSEIRWQAATVLRRMGAVEALIAALKDDDASTRLEAARVMIEMPDPRALEPLIAALKDSNADVRAAAVASLSYIKDPRVVDALIPLLKDESKQVRLYVASALERAKDPRAIDPLLSALKDPSVDVRGRVAMALADLKDSRALGALLEAVRELKAQEVSSPSAKQEALVARGEISRAIGRLLEGVKDPAVVEQLAIALKDPDVNIRLIALAALAKMEAIDQLINMTKDENKSVRTAAIQFFTQTKDARAVEPLIAGLHDSDKEIRRIALLGVQKFKDPRAVEPLINLLKDEDPNVSSGAAYALGETRDARAVEPLLVALLNTNERIRSEAAYALGKIGDARAVEPLIAALKDQSSYVRSRTAQALGEIKDARAIEPLIALLKDQEYRWDAADALKKITGQDFGTDHGKWKQWREKNKGN